MIDPAALRAATPAPRESGVPCGGEPPAHLNELGEDLAGRAGVDRLLSPLDRASEILSAPADHDRRTRVQQHDVPGRASLPGQYALDGCSVLRGRATGDPLHVRGRNPQLLRLHEPLLGAPLLDLDHAGRGGDTDLVDTVSRPDDQRALA